MGWLLIVVALFMIFPAELLALVVGLILVGKVIGMFIEPPNMGTRSGGNSSGGNR